MTADTGLISVHGVGGAGGLKSLTLPAFSSVTPWGFSKGIITAGWDGDAVRFGYLAGQREEKGRESLDLLI